MIDIINQENIDQYTIINVNSIKDSLDKFSFYLEERKLLGAQLDLEEQNLGSRLKLDINNKPASSIICIFFPYLTESHSFDSNISVSAQGIDYHIWAKDKLKRIVQKLQIKYPNSTFSIQVDNGPLNERFFALESGLGYKGINNMVINEVYGSYGFIGLIVTDLVLKEKRLPKKNCINCGKCIEYCPGKALNYKNGFIGQRCASYLTQKKTELSDSEIAILKKSNKVYGCDICQIVCPHNRDIKKSQEIDDVMKRLNLNDIASLSNKEFKKIFGNRAFAWRGKNILVRNFNIIGD